MIQGDGPSSKKGATSAMISHSFLLSNVDILNTVCVCLMDTFHNLTQFSKGTLCVVEAGVIVIRLDILEVLIRDLVIIK